MKDHYYFDNAATSWPKPEEVYRFMDRFFRSHGVNPGRGGHTLAVEAEQMIGETRRLLAAFFGFAGDPERVIFTQNATDSLNTALNGLVGDGAGHVVTTRLEHNSVLRPLYHLERDRGLAVTRVAANPAGYLEPAAIAAALRDDTRVVVINHGSNVLGSVQDLAAIGALLAGHPARLVVDSAQTAGVLPVEMDAWGVDVLTFTGHKGLFGPSGIGGLVVRDGLELPPPRVGGTGVDSNGHFQPDKYPYHLEAGTLNLPGIAGLHAAQGWFAQLGGGGEDHAAACRAGLEQIAARETAHIRHIEESLRAIDGVTVYGPRGDAPRVATLSFNVGSLPATQVGEMLDADSHVCVRAGLHCAPLVHEDLGSMPQKGAVRVSPGYFTEDEDVEHFVAAVAEVAA
ncbi:MAG: aminotransferase class V-fold PLP-dependent enzyme [Gammaproteobacteria bacterium]|nr:aminotransferase class V-fold PLP-dependent enzyme [Gammaproteobacteria bacterium]